MTTSRISGFYNMTLAERLAKLADATNQTPESLSAWTTGGLSPEAADHMIENVIGLHSLPQGIALNFQVNGKDVLVPMTIEEPSVVAGASFMAKLARAGGGFKATTTEPHIIGQMQVLDLQNVHLAQLSLLEHKEELLAEADSVDPVLKKFGGGARNLEARVIQDSPIGPLLVVHLIYDVRDAMGANAVNTNVELLLERMADVPKPQRTARFRCAMVFDTGPDAPQPSIGEGAWEGRITREPRGAGGFGSDPVFEEKGSGRTAAELPSAEKNQRSHRALAWRALEAKIRGPVTG